MILLILGTHEQAFERALDRVLPIAAYQDLTIQHGHTPSRQAGSRVTWTQFTTYEDMVALCRLARGVICHGGVGSIMTALSVGKAPVVIPRLAHYREHVDDHQLQIAAEFERRGCAVMLGSDEGVASALVRAMALRARRVTSESLRRAVAAASG